MTIKIAVQATSIICLGKTFKLNQYLSLSWSVRFSSEKCLLHVVKGIEEDEITIYLFQIVKVNEKTRRYLLNICKYYFGYYNDRSLYFDVNSP